MNEILVRTHKAEYNPGEDIYGVVYLNIVNPTAGRGIQLQFQGYEYFVYNNSDELGNEEKYEAKKDYIDCSDNILHQSEDVLQIGSYVFPFRVPLLTEIPGTFEAGVDGEWEAKVVYWLKAQVIDAEIIQASQYVIVQHRLPVGMLISDPPQAVHVKQEVSRFIFFKKNLFVTARLIDQTQRSGDVGKLRLIITNETGIDVHHISVRLLREIRLISKSRSGKEQTYPSKDSRLLHMENKIYIQPEGGPFVVWENIISECDPLVLNKGLDNIHIPLKHTDDSPVYPTCTGHHIQCQYCIEVVVKLDSDDIATVNVPVPCLLHSKDKEWYSWQPPEWVYNSEVLTTDSPFSVPMHLLDSQAFSGIPRFQALSR